MKLPQMNSSAVKALIRKSNALFPITDTTPPTAVRHARRGWVRCVIELRSTTPSRWIMDRRVPKTNRIKGD